MKNFKKVLALVLAVATVFTFAAMANAAEVKYDDLTDTASITHVEAVQVLTGVGVIQGFEDKTFKPAESVTRVQMAKMVGFIMNDGDDINDLYKAACPFADSKSNWGAGYIAYCATQGIVNGRNATTFDPNATVTGVEAAKMLLCAMGYDATIEGFTGADWSVNVLNVAKKAGLLTDLSQGKMGAALNREDAAQMIFNALKAEEVEYDTKGTTVTINGATIATGASKASTVETVHMQFDGTKGVKAPLLWGEDHFIDSSDTAKQLQTKPVADDNFGIGAKVWQYGKDADGQYIEIAKTLTLAKTFTGVVTAEDIYALRGKIDKNDVVTIKLDGTDAAVVEGATIATWKDVANGGAVNTYTAAQRAKNKIFADEIEVYVDDNDADGKNIQIIGKNYYVGTVTAHKAAKTVSDKEYIVVTDKYGVGLTAKTGKYETTAFTDADVDDETMVIFTFSKKAGVEEIQSLKKIDAVKSGAVTKIATDKDNNLTITADGKVYTFKKGYKPAVETDAEYDLYLDPNGKVIFADKTKAGSSDYFMVMKKAIVEGSGLDAADTVYSVRLLGADGKTVDLNVAEVNDVKNNAGVAFTTEWNKVLPATVPAEDQAIAACEVGTIVTYTLSNKGEAKLTTASTDWAAAAKNIKITSYDNLTNITTDLTATKASGRTTFVLISLDKNDNYVFTPVSGINAMKAAFGNYNYYKDITVSDEPSKGAAKTAALSFIFVDNRNETTTKTVFKALDKAVDPKVEKDGNDVWTYYEINVVEGTEAKTLKVLKAAYDDKIDGNTFVVASGYTVNDAGFVSKITPAASGYQQDFVATEIKKIDDVDTIVFIAGKEIEFEDGSLTINGKAYLNDNIKVYIWDGDAEEFDAKSVSALKAADIAAGTTVTYVMNTNNTSNTQNVTAIYVIGA